MPTPTNTPTTARPSFTAASSSERGRIITTLPEFIAIVALAGVVVLFFLLYCAWNKTTVLEILGIHPTPTSIPATNAVRSQANVKTDWTGFSRPSTTIQGFGFDVVYTITQQNPTSTKKTLSNEVNKKVEGKFLLLPRGEMRRQRGLMNPRPVNYCGLKSSAPSTERNIGSTPRRAKRHGKAQYASLPAIWPDVSIPWKLTLRR